MDFNTVELHVVRHPLKPPSRSPGYDVVAVHGLGGSREISWTTKDVFGQQVMWIKHLLPDYIEDPRVFAYDYTQGPQGDTVCLSVNVLKELAVKLLKRLLSQSTEKDRSLVFVGHNFGGFIIKQALLLAVNSREYSTIAAKTSLMIFFSTPHRAVDMNSWERMSCRMIFATYQRWQGKASDMIDKSSRTLIASSEDFQTIERIYNILNVFEKRESSSTGSPPVIGRYAATLGVPNAESIGREQTHLNICKFQSASDPVFQRVCKAIKTSKGEAS
ncbi:hypothetical protein P154DRAFT_57030 [Amniculicola lignicola CBS 123094]|uniref:DUF676 domain-containing protein n=1 Tax=Amniculicola lignicola CBS 123094 TaxID=1392246 RepID=A0A6A5W856_9PLEO|nr:hypothetical protein P154DRAFT_57030 [Amniculicola lignicola CBS 123094]